MTKHKIFLIRVRGYIFMYIYLYIYIIIHLLVYLFINNLFIERTQSRRPLRTSLRTTPRIPLRTHPWQALQPRRSLAHASLLHDLKGEFGKVIVKMVGEVIVKMFENDIFSIELYIYMCIK